MDLSRPKSRNPDVWIAHCPDFSRPLCIHLRECFLRWEPDLTESIKWNTLCFTNRKLVCALSGCQRHISIAFFRGVELSDRTDLFSGGDTNTSIRSIRITKPDTLNESALRRLLRAAVLLDEDPDRPPLPPNQREPWPMPAFFAAALKKHPAAAANFSAFAPTYQREYLVWLSSAKRDETRSQRLAQTLEALTHNRKWAQRKG